MRDEIDLLLEQSHQTAARTDLLKVVTRAALDVEIKRGRLVAVFPRAYARPLDADVPSVRLAAALASVGGGVARRHLTALKQRTLPVPGETPVHGEIE